MGYIYKITNIVNGKSYIGLTSRHYKDRWMEHKMNKNKEPYCNWPLYRMLNKVGLENTKWEVLEEVSDEKLSEREQYWISFYDSKDNGYNCTYGGEKNKKYDYEKILEYWLNDGERNYTKTAKYFNASKEHISKIIKSLGYETRTWNEINNSNHESGKRKVNQINLIDGKVINTFESIKEAARFMGDEKYSKTICNICKGIRPSYLGFGWQYVEDIGKPINLNKQQKYIILPDYNLSFSTLNECAEWFIKNSKTRSKQILQVANGIRYALNHSGFYQNIKIIEKEKIIYTHYE